MLLGDSSRLITGSADQTAKLWDVKSGSVVYTFNFDAPARSVDFSIGDKLAVITTDPFMANTSAIHIKRITRDPEDRKWLPCWHRLSNFFFATIWHCQCAHWSYSFDACDAISLIIYSPFDKVKSASKLPENALCCLHEYEGRFHNRMNKRRIMFNHGVWVVFVIVNLLQVNLGVLFLFLICERRYLIHILIVNVACKYTSTAQFLQTKNL